MADGAGILSYIAGSGRTLLIVNPDGSINVDFESGVTLDVQESVPTQIRSRPELQVTSQSGGMALASGDCTSVTIKFIEDETGFIYVGGNQGADLPNSGHGLRLSPGDSWTVAIDNFNKVHVFATTSGSLITYAGNQR